MAINIRHFGFVLLPRFNMMTLTSSIEPLRIANYLSTEPLYQWHYLSFDHESVVASNDMDVQCQSMAEKPTVHFDAIFVVGSWGTEHYINEELLQWLQQCNTDQVMICGIEMGVYMLARAKLLSQKLVTTHWSMLSGFAEQYRDSQTCEQIFTIDGNILTCSGGTAGIDLMLHIITADHGEHLAAEIGNQMVHQIIRPAEAPQRRHRGNIGNSTHPHVDEALKLLEANIMEPLKVPEIANRLGVSQRQLERHFKRHLGCSVVQVSHLMRLQYARVLLTTTSLPIREVSVASGFNSMSHFSSAFINCFGKKPSQYRHAWPQADAAPSWPGTVFSLIQASRRKLD